MQGKGLAIAEQSDCLDLSPLWATAWSLAIKLTVCGL